MHDIKTVLEKIALVVALLLSAPWAFADIDIRTVDSLGARVDQASYVVAISDCTQLVSIDVSAGSTIHK